MCGIVGIATNSPDLEMVKRVFRESMVRGKHATGLSYLKNGKINTIKKNIPADEFIDTFNWKRVIDTTVRGNGKNEYICLVGHIRYSTSDLKYPQPLANDDLAIVHNGVISQEPPKKWPYKTKTKNDSELILKARENNEHPLVKFMPSSQAVIELHLSGKLVAYRNEARPLWYSFVEGGVVFTSTKDIANRANLEFAAKIKDYYKKNHKVFNPDKLDKPNKTEMYTEYTANLTQFGVRLDTNFRHSIPEYHLLEDLQ